MGMDVPGSAAPAEQPEAKHEDPSKPRGKPLRVKGGTLYVPIGSRVVIGGTAFTVRKVTDGDLVLRPAK